MKNNLAIVIPAYKALYFKEALGSICNQTDKRFTLYIGDDCSPENLESIVKEFKEDISLVYKKFDHNLGGRDLVAQWERCIDMVQEEEWVWLFSDDDIMEENCVRDFYSTIENGKRFDLYHFDVTVIGGSGEKLEVLQHEFPQQISAYQFYKSRISGHVNSFVIEFIFRREKFMETGRFQNFDLAWGTDVATWIKLSENGGMFTIKSTNIKWRSSGVNISPNVSSEIVIRKLNALIEFFVWTNSFFKKRGRATMVFGHVTMFKRLRTFGPYISKEENRVILKKYCQSFPLAKITFLLMSLGLRIFRKKLNNYCK